MSGEINVVPLNGVSWLSPITVALCGSQRMIWAPIVDKDGTPLSNADGTPQLQEVFNFGKYKDMPVSEVLHKDPGYYSWMIGAEFPNNTKQVLTRIRLREFNKH